LLVAILVLKYQQPLEQAWGFTLREFLMVADLKTELHRAKNGSSALDDDDMEDFIAHLRKKGHDV
jgi:hypothetical protein